MAWWERASHLRNAYAFNAAWRGGLASTRVQPPLKFLILPNNWLSALEYHGMGARGFPGFEHIYYLADPGVSTRFVANIDFSTVAGLAALRGEGEIARPISLHWAMGRRRPDDVIWTTIAIPLIVSDRVVNVLASHRFSGWSTYPVAIVGAAGEQIRGYHGLIVRGRCGALQKQRSIVFQKKYPGGIFPAYRGWYFDESSWDGSDLFMPADPVGHVFVLQEARDALTAARVTGIEWERVDLAERPFL